MLLGLALRMLTSDSWVKTGVAGTMATWASPVCIKQNVAVWAHCCDILYILVFPCVGWVARNRAARKTLSIVAYDLVVRAFSKTVRTPKYELLVNWLPVQTNANTV